MGKQQLGLLSLLAIIVTGKGSSWDTLQLGLSLLALAFGVAHPHHT